MAKKDASELTGPSAKPGTFLFLLGGGVIGAAFASPDLRLPLQLYGYDGGIVQVGVGVGLAFVGSAWALWAFTRPPPPRASISANDAFKARTKQARQDEHHIKAAPGVATPAAAPMKQLSELESLELAIRDVHLRIGKARVALGTGKLSGDGYKSYVDELQKELAELEKQRMELEYLRPKN